MDFKVFIEIPKDSKVKYEVDEKTGELIADRFLHGANYFPFNYGYVVDTKGEDGDPLDVVMLSSQPIYPGVTVKCHAIGYLEMEDDGGIDTKIIAVADKKIDPIYGSYEKLEDANEMELARVKDFFGVYKNLEKGKWVKMGEFQGREKAEELINNSKE